MYFFLQGSPLQFQVCAVFQLSIDFSEHLNFAAALRFVLTRRRDCAVIVAQRIIYGNSPTTYMPAEDDLEEALRLAEE